MPILSHLHQLFDVHSCYAYIHQLRWKDRPRNVPAAKARRSIRGAITTTDPDANATGATDVSVPSTT